MNSLFKKQIAISSHVPIKSIEQNMDEYLVKENKTLNHKTRIIQRNLIYLIGLSDQLANENLLKKQEYMGQYGKIIKTVINDQVYTVKSQEQFSAYITFQEPQSAALALLSLQDFTFGNSKIKAYFGTSKYCSNFIKNIECNNSFCVFQHTLAKIEDTFDVNLIKKNQNIGYLHIKWATDILNQNKFDYQYILKNQEIESIFPSQKIVEKYNNFSIIPENQQKKDYITPKKRKNKLINIIDLDMNEQIINKNEVDTQQDTLSTKENQESYVKNQLEDFDLDQCNKMILMNCISQNYEKIKNSRFNFADKQCFDDKSKQYIRNLIFQCLNQSFQEFYFIDQIETQQRTRSLTIESYL